MKNLRMKLVAAFAAMLCCVALYTTVVAQDEVEVDDGIAGAKDGHGHWHGSIFHCTGTPIDCSNP
jgi:hypothetical protein